MLYVSEIRHGFSKYKQLSGMSCYLDGFTISVVDTKKNETKQYMLCYSHSSLAYRDIARGGKRFSVIPFIRPRMGLDDGDATSEATVDILALSSKQAKIHEFVKRCYTSCEAYTFDGQPGVDRIYPSTARPFEKSGDTLEVILGSQHIQARGHGSIIRMSDCSLVRNQSSQVKQEYKLYTLYDFLIWLCRVCKVNIFQYRKIKAVSTMAIETSTNNLVTTVDLVHTPEAGKFFTKMYVLEVMG